MNKNYMLIIAFFSLFTATNKSHTDDISEYEVRGYAKNAIETYFANSNSWFGSLHKPERLDLVETEKIVAEYALERCYNDYLRTYDARCSRNMIAERLTSRIINRAREIIHNKVEGVPLSPAIRQDLVCTISNNIEHELSFSINQFEDSIDLYGFEDLVHPYHKLAKKDALDQKIEVILQENLTFQQALKKKQSQALPNYEAAHQNREQYKPSAPALPTLPSYQEVVQQIVILPRCGHTTEKQLVATLFESAQKAGKLVSCPTCGKEQYRDQITQILRK